MSSTRLTAAQATVAFLSRQQVEIDGVLTPYFAGCWAIFGHGNVAGLGEALYGARDVFPTFRAHNEQAMAHAAIAFAKQSRRRRAMVCTTSIGPGATNMVTAAAQAHVNRLPVLLLPGDVYASRRPDPVLQQVEDFTDATATANDAFRPVSRLFDRITRPEQILDALPRAMSVLLDPAACGPVTLAFCQDVQAEAFDVPDGFLRERVWRMRAPPPEPEAVDALAAALRGARRPVIVAGGGVLYAGAETALADLAAATGLPVTETQAGKGALAWDHPANLGGAGVTGSAAANLALEEADLVVGIGTRLQDFTTGSRALVDGRRRRLVQVNVAPHDAAKHDGEPVVADARRLIATLVPALGDWRAPDAWRQRLAEARDAWTAVVDATVADDGRALPTDAQVLGAVRRGAAADSVVVCAAGGLPGELHRLWRATPGGYHMEYGFSCMGYEIAGGLGVKMAEPEREVHVLVGDGSYLMLNSEIATSVMLGCKLVITVLDNRGFGCIDRLQRGGGAPGFNNLLADTLHETLPAVDFAAHAASLGAWSRKVGSIAALEAALVDARGVDRTCVLVIDTDPAAATAEGGAWWDVARPQVSAIKGVRRAREDYDARTRARDQGE